MATATEAIYQGSVITVAKAISLQDRAKKAKGAAPAFSCTECGKPVKPHRTGGHAGEHFEHYKRNPSCTLSHKGRGVAKSIPVPTHDIEDKKAVEGYLVDRSILMRARNPDIAIKRKQKDNYTCAVCEFHLHSNGHYIIECHHLNPLAATGTREVSLSDLISLCPTCHRIAHTREVPFTVNEIKQLRGLP